MSQESDIGAFWSSLLKSWGIPGYCDEPEKEVESHLSFHPIQSAFAGESLHSEVERALIDELSDRIAKCTRATGMVYV